MLPATTLRPGTKRPVDNEWDAPDILDLITQCLHPDWHIRGLCRQYPEQSWFPDHGSDFAEIEACKAVCRSCPVQSQCLDHALTEPEPTGIWGGMGPRERRRMRRL